MTRINIRNGEFWRVERLVKTYKSIPKEHQDKLVSMHDHEGDLSVQVTEKPISDELAAAIRNAWMERFEDEDRVFFFGPEDDIDC